MVYFPLVSAGAITGVAVIPPGHRMSFLGLGGSEYVPLKCLFQRTFPAAKSIPKMLSDTPVAMPISFGPLLVLTFSAMSIGNRACICRGSLSSFTFHRSLMFFAFAVVRILSSLCQLVRC